MTRSAKEWTAAYARQSAADLATFDRMQGLKDAPDCHKLLFLQMGCEKLAKAHLCDRGSDPVDLRTSHGYTAKHVPIIVRMLLSRYPVKSPTWVLYHSKHLAEEIELLSPQVDRNGTRPDNCEYPWEDGQGKLHVPMESSFAASQLLNVPAARTFLKLIRFAADALR